MVDAVKLRAGIDGLNGSQKIQKDNIDLNSVLKINKAQNEGMSISQRDIQKKKRNLSNQ